MNTKWYVVYVRTPREATQKISATAQRQLAENLQFARELGAKPEIVEGSDIVETLVGFARSHHISYVILGHSERSRWEELWRGN